MSPFCELHWSTEYLDRTKRYFGIRFHIRGFAITEAMKCDAPEQLPGNFNTHYLARGERKKTAHQTRQNQISFQNTIISKLNNNLKRYYESFKIRDL